jgi:hypothetical protein
MLPPATVFCAVKVNPQTFFNFCSHHVSLLRALADGGGEFSEAELMRLIKIHSAGQDELPQTAWRNLRDLQILVTTEPGSETYLLAEPVAGLLAYLQNEANPATPELIRGYVQSLETLGQRLSVALTAEDVTVVKLAFDEITVTLRRIYADLDQTHHAILTEVANYKTERYRVAVRDKFRRIVYWMERYVEPMIELVRADGPLRAAFDETERLLQQARAQTLFNDLPALDRNLRHLRLVGTHALRVFIQSRKEIQPLYESLRRSSLIAEGAALALRKLQNDGLSAWGTAPLISICAVRIQNVPGDRAISLALRRIVEHPPEPPPTLDLEMEDPAPAALARRQWLDALPEQVRPILPLNDLLGWMIREHPGKDLPDVLAGLSELVFHEDFDARFLDGGIQNYQTATGQLSANPVQLHAT